MAILYAILAFFQCWPLSYGQWEVALCFLSLMLIFQAWKCQQGLVNNTAKLSAIPFTLPDMSWSTFVWSILSHLVRKKPTEPSSARLLTVSKWILSGSFGAQKYRNQKILRGLMASEREGFYQGFGTAFDWGHIFYCILMGRTPKILSYIPKGIVCCYLLCFKNDFVCRFLFIYRI